MKRFLGDVASIIYAQHSGGSDIQSFIPRSKFQFNVTILYNGLSGGLATYSTLPLAGSQLLRVSDITMPSHTARTATYNQYNRKRVIQTGVDYVPIELTVYDTRDGVFDNWLVNYHDYYYKGVMTPHDNIYENDIHADRFSTTYSDVGLRLRDDRNFIKEIVITRKSSKQDTSTIRIYNPVIQSVTGDQLNYSDSQPVQYKITFVYEGYSIQDEDPYPVTESGNPTLSNMGDYKFNSAERYWEYAEKVTGSGSPTDPLYQRQSDSVDRYTSPPGPGSSWAAAQNVAPTEGNERGETASPTFKYGADPKPVPVTSSAKTFPVGSATLTETGNADSITEGPTTPETQYSNNPAVSPEWANKVGDWF